MSSLQASSGYGVSVNLQSPLVQETDSGTIVTASFLITNHSSEKENFLPILSLPTGWIPIPFEEPFFSLDPGESTVQLFAFRVPPDAQAEDYTVSLTVRGQKHPNLISQADFQVKVLQKIAFKSSIFFKPKYTLSKNSYAVQVRVVNYGNVQETIQITAIEQEGFTLHLEASSFILQPKESKIVTITATPPQDFQIQEPIKHFLSLTIQGSILSETLITDVEIFPQNSPKGKSYESLPMKTVFGYGMKNSQKQLFIEQYATGSIGKEKNLDLFFRAPFISDVNVDRDLGGTPENGYVHYFDPLIDAYAGDGIYALTPLTMLNRFARGGSVSIQPAPVSLKGLYLQDSSSLPQSVFGEQISYTPFSFLSLSLSSIQTHLKKKSEKLLQTKQNTATYSLFSDLHYETWANLSLEYADTGSFSAPNSPKNGYYAYAKGSFPANVWYAIQKIYAGSQFTGYYQDTDQLYASIGFPIIKRLQSTFSYNFIEYNLNKSQKQENAPRNQNAYGGLSYSFPFGLYTSCFYNFSRASDALTQQGYQTHFLSVNGGKSFNKWTLQALVEYGRYYERKNQYPNRVWQNYQFYTYYQPTPRSQYALYTRIGYVELSSQIEWARIYGLSSASSLTKRLQLQLLYEYTDQKHFRNYFSTKIKYTRKNGSFFELQGYWNKSTLSHSVTEFLLSYTIPWNLPIRRNRSIGNLQGRILQETTDSPLPSLVVNCNGLRTLTDSKGNFSFPSLQPGDYYIWTEERLQGKICANDLPLTTAVEGGKTTKVNISFETPALLKGSIFISDSTQEKISPLSRATFTLESAKTQKKLILTADEQGCFYIDNLVPGRWLLSLLKETLPPYHQAEQEEILIDLFPGEEKSLEIKILPIKRNMRIIDQDIVR